jgi:hypothetical protein
LNLPKLAMVGVRATAGSQSSPCGQRFAGEARADIAPEHHPDGAPGHSPDGTAVPAGRCCQSERRADGSSRRAHVSEPAGHGRQALLELGDCTDLSAGPEGGLTRATAAPASAMAAMTDQCHRAADKVARSHPTTSSARTG